MPYKIKHPAPKPITPLAGFFRLVGISVKEYSLSFNETRDALNVAIQKLYPAGSPSIMDMGPDWCVYGTIGGQLYRVTYKIDETGWAVLDGQPVQVTRHEVYLPVGTDPAKVLHSVPISSQAANQAVNQSVMKEIDACKKILQGVPGKVRGSMPISSQVTKQTTAKEFKRLPKGVSDR